MWKLLPKFYRNDRIFYRNKVSKFSVEVLPKLEIFTHMECLTPSCYVLPFFVKISKKIPGRLKTILNPKTLRFFFKFFVDILPLFWSKIEIMEVLGKSRNFGSTCFRLHLLQKWIFKKVIKKWVIKWWKFFS